MKSQLEKGIEKLSRQYALDDQIIVDLMTVWLDDNGHGPAILEFITEQIEEEEARFLEQDRR